MKFTYLLFIIALTTSLSFEVTAQKALAAMSENEVKALLTHKWKITHMESEGKRFSMNEQGYSYLTIFEAGTFYFDNKETGIGPDYSGTWTYDHKTKTVITVENDPEKHKLLKLTATELSWTWNIDGQQLILIMKRVK